MQDYATVQARIIEVLARHAQPGATIVPQTEIVAELGLDSPQVLELVMELEDAFDVSVSMNALSEVQTVRDLAQVVHRLTEASG